MFELIFGLAWLGITAMVSIPFFVVGNEAGGGEATFPLILFFLVFWAIGIGMFVVGFRKLMKNSKTEKYGEECYGIVKGQYPSGTVVNGRPIMKAEVELYVPSEYSTKVVSETVSFKEEYKYRVGSAIIVKYYEDDINFVDVVRPEEIPLNIQEQLGISKRNININNTTTTTTNNFNEPNKVMCTYCGSLILETAKFCPNCGTKTNRN